MQDFLELAELSSGGRVFSKLMTLSGSFSSFFAYCYVKQ